MPSAHEMLIVGLPVAVVVLAAVFALRWYTRRRRDTIDSFRRQIDALSSEARRPVVDQVEKARHDHPPQSKRKGGHMTDGDGNGT